VEEAAEDPVVAGAAVAAEDTGAAVAEGVEATEVVAADAEALGAEAAPAAA